jgi:hypothetical protein
MNVAFLRAALVSGGASTEISFGAGTHMWVEEVVCGAGIARQAVTAVGAGVGVTILDAGAARRFFTLNSGCNLVLKDLTLRNGVGGAVYVKAGSTLGMDNVALQDNVEAASGGAINNDGGTVSGASVQFTNNSFYTNYGGTLNMSNVVLQESVVSAVSGGTIWLGRRDLANGAVSFDTLQTTTLPATSMFQGNTAAGGATNGCSWFKAGGVNSVSGCSKPVLYTGAGLAPHVSSAIDGTWIKLGAGTHVWSTTVTCSGKTLAVTGAGVSLTVLDAGATRQFFSLGSGCHLVLQHLTLRNGNAGSVYGGVVHVHTGARLDATSVEFKNNRAYSGGAVNVQNPGGAHAVFDTCSFVGNSATYDGGAVRVYGGSGATFRSCSFVQNAASRYAGAVYGVSYATATFLTVLPTNSFSSNTAGRTYGDGNNNCFVTYLSGICGAGNTR